MDKPRHFEGVKFEPGQGYLPDHDEPLMCFDPKRYDPDAADKARAILERYRRPNREICLRVEQADRLEQAIEEAIHAAKVTHGTEQRSERTQDATSSTPLPGAG